MASKRMFDKAIIDTDRFMDMPISTKGAYFLLGMEADDEGFVSFKKVMRIHGLSEDDVKLLAAKQFVIIFESGVAVITDWNKNNWLDSRRLRPTEYQTEKSLLSLTETKEYVLSNRLASIEESRGEERSTEEIASDAPAEPETPEKPEKKFKIENADPRCWILLKEFERVNPTCATYKENITQIKACENLIKLYNFETIMSLIPHLKKTNTMNFFPNITTPHQMLEKYQSLLDAIVKARREQIADNPFG